MIAPSTNAAFLNSVINHPSVFPYVSLKLAGPFDLSAAVEDPRNIFLANEYGGFLCLNHGEGVYEVHTQFLPDGRGAGALLAAKQAMQHMFTQTDCERLETFVQDAHPHVRRFTLQAGFEKRESVTLLDTPMCRYELTKERWLSCQ